MFLGHFGVALACKKVTPKTSLGLLFFAAQFLDLIWPVFVLIGWEKVRVLPGSTAFTPLEFVSYPVSHSLMMTLVWAILVCFLHLTRHMDLKATGTLLLLVVSHWVLDLVSHKPDLPIVFGEDVHVGLGLWNSVWGTIVVESLIFGGGLFLYLKSTTARDNTGRFALWGLCVFLVLVWLAGAFGPPPPNSTSVAVVTLGLWLLVWWGGWIDRHRAPADIAPKAP